MITFGRLTICIVSALLTGCAGCPLPGQPTPTAKDLFSDKSTCECNYLLRIPDPNKDIQREDDQTSKVIAMVPDPNRATYSFRVSADQDSLKRLAKAAPNHMLVFKGCRASDVKEGEDFVLNVGTPLKKE